MQQKQEQQKVSSKKYLEKDKQSIDSRVNLKHDIKGNPPKILQSSLMASERLRERPKIWNVGGSVPNFSNLQCPLNTPKSHDSRFQKPIQENIENFKLYVSKTE